MNNIKQKNIIYGRDRKRVLAHPTAESVRFSQNSNITDARVNNAMQQLLNNDLYIENRLVADMNYQSGPSRAQNEQDIAALPNGAKRWVDSGDYTLPLQIYRKVDRQLSASVTSVRNAAAVNFIAGIGNIVFVAFSDKLMYDVGSGLTECVDLDGGSSVNAVGYYTCDDGTFFVSDTDAYILSGSGLGSEYGLSKIDIGSDVTGLKCVAYDAGRNLLYVGGSGGLFKRGSYTVKQGQPVTLSGDMKFCDIDIYTSTNSVTSYFSDSEITVNAIQILDPADRSVNAKRDLTNVLAATNKGLFRSKTQAFFAVDSYGVGGKPVAVAAYGEYIFVLNEVGKLKYKTGQDRNFSDFGDSSTTFSDAKDMAAHSTGLYIAYSGGIARFTSYVPPRHSLEFSKTGGISAVAVDTLFDDRIVFAASGDTVYYYSNPAKVGSFKITAGTVLRLVSQPRKNVPGAIDLYILAEDGSGNRYVYSAYMRFKSGLEYDYTSRIYGLESVDSGVDAVAYGIDKCYYVKQGSIYNAETGKSGRLGDIKAEQMDYFSTGDGGILAIAADTGLYTVNADSFDVISYRRAAGLKYVSQRSNAVYYASDSVLNAISKEPNGELGSFPAEKSANIAGVVVSEDKTYILSSGGQLMEVGSRQVRETLDCENEGDSRLPVIMPYIEEIDSSTAIGVSDSRLYKIIYGAPNGYFEISAGGVDVSDTSVKAFCKAGENVFVAADSNIYRYQVDADAFDPQQLSNMAPSATAAVAATDLVYSGTDTTFDMRIYANTAGGWKRYVPSRTNKAKLDCGAVFSDFLSYIDSNDPDDDTDPVFKAVTLGINGTDLSVNVNTVADGSSSWGGSWRLYQLSNDAGQTELQPYALYFLANSRVYVAYTAKTGTTFTDCIAAVTTDNLLDTSVTSDIPDKQIIFSGMTSRTQNIRFSGFQIDSGVESGEDIDVIAAYSGGKIITLKVDVNVAVNMNRGETSIGVIDGAKYFQPDCMVIDGSPSRYYIALPRRSSNNLSIDIDLYEYNNGSNRCSRVGWYNISDIESATVVKDVFIVGSPCNSPDIVDFLVYIGTNRAYYVRIEKSGTVSWTKKTAAKSTGTAFSKIRRFGPNQLIGYGATFIYDFQTRTNYGGFSNIGNVYLTDNGDSRDFMLYLNSSDKKIYSSDPDMAMSFVDAPTNVKAAGNTYVKADNTLFVIDWDNNTIYREKQDGSFEDFGSGAVFKSSNKIDGSVYAENGKYYLCVMRSSGYIDVYRIGDTSSGGSIALESTYTSDTAAGGGYISRMVYLSNGSALKRQIQQTVKTDSLDVYGYSGPVISQSGNEGDFSYMPPNAEARVEISNFSRHGGTNTYRRIGKNCNIPYGVRPNGTGATTLTIEMLPPGSGTKNVPGSKDAWYVGNGYFGQTASGGKFDGGTGTFSDFGDGKTFSDIVGAAGKRYYFLDGAGNLYRSAGLPTHPIYEGYIPFVQVQSSQYGGSTPVRLASGRYYAGLVCATAAGIQQLYVLWPNGDPSQHPTSGGEGGIAPGGNVGYGVAAVAASFVDFPDGGNNPKQIVPLGDFLDEIVVCEGGYLHIANVSDGLLIQDGTGKSQIPITETMPYNGYAAVVEAGISRSAKLGRTRYLAGNSNYLSAFSDSTAGLAMKILNSSMTADDISARSFHRTDINKFLVATDRGVYRYMHVEGSPRVSRMSTGNLDVRSIAFYDFMGTGVSCVMANQTDNFMYRSENGRMWWKDFKPVSAGTFTSVYPKNQHEWYFGSTAGLYKTEYSYVEVDDLKKFTETDLYNLYAELMRSTISSRCEQKIAQHELSPSYEYGHLSSFIDDINTKILGVDFDGFQANGWQTYSGGLTGSETCYQVTNDMVFEQHWGSQDSWDVAVSLSNMFVQTPNAKFTYMFRRWMSGFTELYVHLPTTNTYYVNHVSSTPDYTIDPESAELIAENVQQFGRDKLQFSHDPNAVYTRISLTLDLGAFHVDALLGAQACGNSLPLKIYKETAAGNPSESDIEPAQYFNSYIAPTVMIRKGTDSETGGTVFDFACFGADEQVIRLEFFDDVYRPNDTYYRIVFDPNGAPVGQNRMTQRVKADRKKYRLRRNQYSWSEDHYLFAGWSFSQTSANPDTGSLNSFYSDMQEITSDEIESHVPGLRPGGDATLYAVWISYSFGATDTTFTVSPPPGKTQFRISGIDTFVNPDSSKIGERVIIKFEDA